MLKKLPYKKNQVYFNTKIKKYPDGNFHITYCSDMIYKDKTIEKVSNNESTHTKRKISDEEKEEKFLSRQNTDPRDDSILRAKRRVFDLVYINSFKYFVTLTFDLTKGLNPRNPVEVRKAVQDFVKNRVHRNGLQYILVPEYHTQKEWEQSKRLHLHGFFNEPEKGLTFIPAINEYGNLVFSKSGRQVYNVTEWADEYGFTTACRVDSDLSNCAKYITKYITKNSKMIFGNYYLAGGVKREVPTDLAICNFGKVEKEEFKVKDEKVKRFFKYESSWDGKFDQEGNELPICSYLDDFDFAVGGVRGCTNT